jgi:hypothetical protein
VLLFAFIALGTAAAEPLEARRAPGSPRKR